VLATENCRNDCGGKEFIGAGVGYAAWVAIDVAALAYRPVEADPPKVGLAPILTPSTKGLGVFGVF
jgi:hypothetical protein